MERDPEIEEIKKLLSQRLIKALQGNQGIIIMIGTPVPGDPDNPDIVVDIGPGGLGVIGGASDGMLQLTPFAINLVWILTIFDESKITNETILMFNTLRKPTEDSAPYNPMVLLGGTIRGRRVSIRIYSMPLAKRPVFNEDVNKNAREVNLKVLQEAYDIAPENLRHFDADGETEIIHPQDPETDHPYLERRPPDPSEN